MTPRIGRCVRCGWPHVPLVKVGLLRRACVPCARTIVLVKISHRIARKVRPMGDGAIGDDARGSGQGPPTVSALLSTSPTFAQTAPAEVPPPQRSGEPSRRVRDRSAARRFGLFAQITRPAAGPPRYDERSDESPAVSRLGVSGTPPTAGRLGNFDGGAG